MLRCSFLILSAARSRALRTVVPLPSPTVVPFLSSRTACAAALSLAFSTQLIVFCLSFCFYLFESFHGFEDFFSDSLYLLLRLVSRLIPGLFLWRRGLLSLVSCGFIICRWSLRCARLSFSSRGIVVRGSG